MSKLVTYSLADGVASIVFNRPDALNAFTPDLLIELVQTIEAAEASPEARVIVLSGAGRAFSAGVDLKVLQGIEPKAGRIGDIFDGVAFKAAETLRKTRLPAIAKVHGFCFTGALELALHCDFILTTAETKFGDTHAKWGLRPTWGMSQNLARAVGVRRARELSFTARTFTGAEAAEWGLANAAAPSQEDLDALALKTAREIAAGSAGAVAAYKNLYALHEENPGLEDALREEVAREFPEIDDTAARLKGFA